jgi:hypothetical protein
MVNIHNAAFCFIIALLLYGCNVQKVSADTCKSLQKGRFTQHLYNTSGLGHWKHVVVEIDRSDSIEIRTTKFPLDLTSRYKIEWLDGCQYKLHVLELKTFADTMYSQMYPKGSKHKILKTTNEYVIEKTGNSIDTLWRD